MEKSINQHQKELISLQKKAFEELQDSILRAKYSSDDKYKALDQIDARSQRLAKRIEQKRSLINHYYGETVV
jgi:hypothetical protein